MMRHFRNRPSCPTPPHWWPQGEAWPPPFMGPGGPERHRSRGRYCRQFRFLAFAFFFLVIFGAAALGRFLASSFGIFGGVPRPLIVAAVIFASFSLFTLFSRMLSRRFTMPLDQIMEGAERVTGGDYSTRVTESGPPAMRSLGHAFNV